MSQQVVNILVSAGGIIVAAAILAAVRGVFKVAKAIRENTETVARLSAEFTGYTHSNDTEKAVMKADIQDLKDWRLRAEATNRAAALSSGTGGSGA